MYAAHPRYSDLLVIAFGRDVTGTTVRGITVCTPEFLAADELPMIVQVEIRLYLGERLTLGLGHEHAAEHAAGERQDGVDGEVGGHAVSDDHPVVSGDHDGGRGRDDQQYGRVGPGPRVRREVLALDDAQQRHDADVDEELDAGQRPEERQPAVAVAIARHEAGGHGHVTGGRAEARDDHQRSPAELVHGQREGHGGRHDDDP